jgi:hypothetical protein
VPAGSSSEGLDLGLGEFTRIRMYRNDTSKASSWHYGAFQPSLADTADLAQSMDE